MQNRPNTEKYLFRDAFAHGQIDATQMLLQFPVSNLISTLCCFYSERFILIMQCVCPFCENAMNWWLVFLLLVLLAIQSVSHRLDLYFVLLFIFYVRLYFKFCNFSTHANHSWKSIESNRCMHIQPFLCASSSSSHSESDIGMRVTRRKKTFCLRGKAKKKENVRGQRQSFKGAKWRKYAIRSYYRFKIKNCKHVLIIFVRLSLC